VSDTAFTAPAHWGWLIVGYFFFGGLAAGSYAIAALIDLFGRPEDRPAARIGYLVALPILAFCPPLLIVDLDRPLRFWHLFVMSERPGVMFKWWSPMSIGSWALLLFSACAAASFVGAIGETREGRGLLGRLAVLRRGALRPALAIVGAALGFFVAGYTGVLLSVTNRPLWSDTPLVGALFLASSMAASAALAALIAARKPLAAPVRPWLARMEHGAAALEVVLLVAFFATTGGVAAWRGPFGLLLAAVVVLGVLVPLGAGIALKNREGSWIKALVPAIGSVLASLALRAAVVFASEAVRHA
jgi:formate-dependent nitrite reductase membrane component NrfD